MGNEHWQKIANLVFELDKKVVSRDANPSAARIHDRMKAVVEEAGIFIYDPTGEQYSETRTDVDANISGTSASNLVIKEVIKPVLYTNDGGKQSLLQRGVVIAGSV
jgi:hypothetical protein